MAFTGNWTCNTFKTGLMNGVYNFTSGNFYITLFTNAATLNQYTTGYTSGIVGEVSATGYTAGGEALTISQTPTTGNSGTTAYISFNNATWTGSFTARGALIYLNNGTTNPAVCVLDFGSDKTSSQTFTVQFPAPTNTSAIITLS
jgi:hypothetical protein